MVILFLDNQLQLTPKTKVQQCFKAMYRFISSTYPAIIKQNVKLSCELKTKFMFVYAACISTSVMKSAHMLVLVMLS